MITSHICQEGLKHSIRCSHSLRKMSRRLSTKYTHEKRAGTIYARQEQFTQFAIDTKLLEFDGTFYSVYNR